MAYVSQRAGETRLFDCIYDPSFIVAGKKDAVKASASAMLLSAPINISPKYDSMFNNLDMASRQVYWRTKPSSPVHRLVAGGSNDNATKMKSRLDCRGTDIDIFYRHVAKYTPVINVRLDESCPQLEPTIIKERSKTSRPNQTLYRESSAQTHVFEPDTYSVDDSEKSFEVLTIAKFITNTTEIGEFEVRTIERARKRRHYAKCLRQLHAVKDAAKQRAILEAFEWEEWIAREEDIENCQKLRMEIVCKMFEEREMDINRSSAVKFNQATESLHQKRDHDFNKIQVNYLRDLRKLEAKHNNIPRRYQRQGVVEEHVDRGSDLYGPQMRFGVNPKRRNFTGFQKKFSARLDSLETKANQTDAFRCPFSKLREMAKPKEKVKEVAQRFRSDNHLKKLYEHLKFLRNNSTTKKGLPNCLRDKQRQTEIPVAVDGMQRGTGVEFVSIPFNIQEETNEAIIDGIGSEVNFDSSEFERRTLDFEALCQQKLVDEVLRNRKKTEQILAKFEGTTIGRMFEFLQHELKRLAEQKRFHAIFMLAEKERHKREASEAGTRQKENRRRIEQEETFRTADNATLDMVTVFLERVLAEECESLAQNEARNELEMEAKSIEKDTRRASGKIMTNTDTTKSYDDKQIINDLLNTFVYPEVQKRMSRQDNELKTQYVDSAIKDTFNQHLEAVLMKKTHLEEHLEIVDGIIPQIFRNVLPSEESTSEASTTDNEGEYEAKVAIKKLLKRTVPKRTWLTSAERITKVTLDDIMARAIDNVELCKATVTVARNESLQIILDDLKAQLREYMSLESSDKLTGSGPIKPVANLQDVAFLPRHDSQSGSVKDEIAYIEEATSYDTLSDAGRPLGHITSDIDIIKRLTVSSQGPKPSTEETKPTSSDNDSDRSTDHVTRAESELLHYQSDFGIPIQPIESAINIIDHIYTTDGHIFQHESNAGIEVTAIESNIDIFDTLASREINECSCIADDMVSVKTIESNINLIKTLSTRENIREVHYKRLSENSSYSTEYDSDGRSSKEHDEQLSTPKADEPDIHVIVGVIIDRVINDTVYRAGNDDEHAHHQEINAVAHNPTNRIYQHNDGTQKFKDVQSDGSIADGGNTKSKESLTKSNDIIEQSKQINESKFVVDAIMLNIFDEFMLC